jgi:hypothetical protein
MFLDTFPHFSDVDIVEICESFTTTNVVIDPAVGRTNKINKTNLRNGSRALSRLCKCPLMLALPIIK